MADPEHADYNDSNRAFLQLMFARNCVTFEAIRPALAAIFSAQEDREVVVENVSLEDFQSYVATANEALLPFDYQIRNTFHQQTRERSWALVNTTSDALTQLATTYSADEIAYVKRLLDAMFDGPANKGKKEAMCLPTMEAVQLHRKEVGENGVQQPTHQNFTMKDAENMLVNLVEEGWLEKSQTGFYSLTPRALMELKGWLVETYNDPGDDDGEGKKEKIKFCAACKEIVTVGQRCSNRECLCRLHNICTQNFFRMQRSKKCPICETEWDGKSYVGEKAITMSKSYKKGTRRCINRGAAYANGENEDEDGEREEEGD